MSNVTYEAAVYTRTITYKNFKGETKTVELHFALDPLQLMQIIAGFEVKAPKNRSGNPAKRAEEPQITDEQQLKFVRDLAIKAAGSPSDDGESWFSYEGFDESLAGKAFLTKLASSDGDRVEFSQKVVLDPFRAFIDFARADPTNNPKEVQQFDVMLKQMENIFRAPEPAAAETIEERKARLKAELDAMDES